MVEEAVSAPRDGADTGDEQLWASLGEEKEYSAVSILERTPYGSVSSVLAASRASGVAIATVQGSTARSTETTAAVATLWSMLDERTRDMNADETRALQDICTVLNTTHGDRLIARLQAVITNRGAALRRMQLLDLVVSVTQGGDSGKLLRALLMHTRFGSDKWEEWARVHDVRQLDMSLGAIVRYRSAFLSVMLRSMSMCIRTNISWRKTWPKIVFDAVSSTHVLLRRTGVNFSVTMNAQRTGELVKSLVNTARPDYDRVLRLVRTCLDRAEGFRDPEDLVQGLKHAMKSMHRYFVIDVVGPAAEREQVHHTPVAHDADQIDLPDDLLRIVTVEAVEETTVAPMGMPSRWGDFCREMGRMTEEMYDGDMEEYEHWLEQEPDSTTET
jgi:hypothetical protein